MINRDSQSGGYKVKLEDEDGNENDNDNELAQEFELHDGVLGVLNTERGAREC